MIAYIGRYKGLSRFSRTIRRVLKMDEDRYTFVKTHKHDCYDISATLSKIALPLIKRLKKEMVGVPFIDLSDSDIPVEFRETDGDDPYNEKAWNWILNEIIWAMEETANNYPEEDEIISSSDKNYTGYPSDEVLKYSERLNRAFRLFGKYYQSLWN